MNDNTSLYSATMAKDYASQGYLEKSTEIYRYLLKNEPDREEYRKALDEVENSLKEMGKTESKDLVLLFSEWFELLLEHKKLTAPQIPL
jgi:hypothetical protein